MKPLDIKKYRVVKYALISEYKWGQGWHMTDEDKELYLIACRSIARDLKFKIIEDKVFNTITGVNKKGEKLYFHPMEIAGTILLDRYNEIMAKIIKHECKYFQVDIGNCSLREIPIVNFPYQHGYRSNPNVIVEDYFPKK